MQMEHKRTQGSISAQERWGGARKGNKDGGEGRPGEESSYFSQQACRVKSSFGKSLGKMLKKPSSMGWKLTASGDAAWKKDNIIATCISSLYKANGGTCV